LETSEDWERSKDFSVLVLPLGSCPPDSSNPSPPLQFDKKKEKIRFSLNSFVAPFRMHTVTASPSSGSSSSRESMTTPIFRHGARGNGAAAATTTSTLRSESMAYPPSSSTWPQLQFFLRQHTRAVGATVAFLTFVVVITSDYLHDTHVGSSIGNMRGGRVHTSSGSSTTTGSSSLFGAFKPGYFSVQDSITPTGFQFGMVTDLDQLSAVPGNPGRFQSHFVAGFLQKSPPTPGSTYIYEIRFDETVPVRHLVTGHNEANRGAEFSELNVFGKRLYTFDDRTGQVVEILNTETGQDSFSVPRAVITEGSGDTDKGMKWEWASVKDDELYMGSMGKEYTNLEGEIVNVNNLWVSVVNLAGNVRRENWVDSYLAVRKAVGAVSPGYIIVEACNWSSALQKWVFLPRRISADIYNDVLDEKRGGRQLVMLNADFTGAVVVDLNLSSLDPLKGFSSFKFVPGTADQHILAIRSVEEDCTGELELCKQRSYLVVLNVLTGEQLSPEVKYEQDWKFEGLEFFNPFVKPPV
jgi:soluble calcium-activated nucleotidase 1